MLAFFYVLYIMDIMVEENKNLKIQIKYTSHSIQKDSRFSQVPASYEEANHLPDMQVFHIGSYTKTTKLVSALYMVTDIMDKEEPLRNKLRNLGSNIISDIHSFDKGQALCNQINSKVFEVMSFLEIASSVGIISEMNSSILIKEFGELRKSVLEITPKNDQNWLQEFMREEEKLGTNVPEMKTISIGQRNLSNGQNGTRIGVQKGSTLMKALSDRVPEISRTNKINNNDTFKKESGSNFAVKHDVLKDKRHEEIVSIIKDKMKNSIGFDGLTITDIKFLGKNLPGGEIGALASCGEKTLQRELVSMVSAGILKKTGEKRWSRYSLK